MGEQLENSKTNGQGRKHNCCDQQLFEDTEGLKGAKDSGCERERKREGQEAEDADRLHGEPWGGGGRRSWAAKEPALP